MSAFDTTKVGWEYDVILAWNVLFPPTITNTDIENRKIFNACMFG